MDIVRRVEQTILEEHLLNKEVTIIAAVSGGPDSVALLHLLTVLAADWRWKIVVAHVNHQFRIAESEEEAVRVAELAEQFGLPFELGVLNVPEYIRQSGLNSQVAARKKRYDFLFEIARKYKASSIALAHHADDQAETVLMRVIRGTGIEGLSGMPIRRMENNVELIRPLLRITKSELITYCNERHLLFSIDSSNLKRKYFRNQVRLDVIPFLTKYNPKLPEALHRMAEFIRPEAEFLALETERCFNELVTLEEQGWRFSRKPFSTLHIALQRRMIKLILSYLISVEHASVFQKIESVRTAILQDETPSLKLDLSGTYELIREYDDIAIIRKTQTLSAAGDFDYEIHGQSGSFQIAEANCRVTYEVMENGALQMAERPKPDEAWFDADALTFPLHIRNRRAGDRMRIQGLNGSKKVKDMFIDQRIVPSKREILPLLVEGDRKILWIPGLRRSEHASQNEHTKRILHMKIEPLSF